jgi:hypothetical protein
MQVHLPIVHPNRGEKRRVVELDLSLTERFLTGDDKAVFDNTEHPFNVNLNSQLGKASDLKKGEYVLFFAYAGHTALYDSRRHMSWTGDPAQDNRLQDR